MIPLSKRLAEAAWASEWPAGAVLGETNALPTPSDWVPHALEWPRNNALKVIRALTVEGATPVSLEQAHRVLNQLEEWTERQRAILTWPASPLAFARALNHSASVGDEGVAVVVSCYPAYCERMLEEARTLDPRLPEFTHIFGLKGYRKAPRVSPPVQPSSEPAPAEPPSAEKPADAPAELPFPHRATEPVVAERASASAEPVDRAPSAGRRQERQAPTSPVAPPTPSPWLMKWVEQLEGFPQPVLASEFLNQKVKDSVNTHRGSEWQWFDQVFLEALFSLPEKEMRQLLDHWPTHTKFKPSPTDNPNKLARWFDQKRLWAWWRDAGPERQGLLATGGLARVIDGASIYQEDMPDFLGHITMYTKKNSTAFRQRLQLWESLGGKLDEPIPSSPLLDSQNVGTVREWILAQENKEWASVLETVAPEVHAPPRRFPRGPGR